MTTVLHVMTSVDPLLVELCAVCCQMIHLPIYRHTRRFLASMVVFGSIVLVMLWLPVQVVRYVFPDFLPFHVMLSRLELLCA